jgi:hypothetical protein
MMNSQSSLHKSTAEFPSSQEINTTPRYPTPLKEQETLDHNKKADGVISSESFNTPFRLTQAIATSLPKTDEVELRNNLIEYDENASGQTEMKFKTHKRILLAEQTETEERKYYKLKRSGETKINSQRALHVSNSFSKEQASQKTIPSQGQQDDVQSQSYHSQRHRTGLASKTKRKDMESMYLKEYVPNNRFKPDTEYRYFQEKVELYDKLTKDFVQFRVFKESDLCNNRLIQGLLKDADADDDCQTDTEQLELATNHVNKQLKKALDFQNNNVTEDYITFFMGKDSSESSQEIFSFGSFRAPIQKQNSSFEAGISQNIEQNSDTLTKVAKKLSYNEEILNMTQKSPPSI